MIFVLLVRCRVQWTDAMIKVLLSEMHAHAESFTSSLNRQMWKNIAASVNNYGYNLTADNCYIKWNSMKKKYKKIKDANNRSGAAKETWEYFDVMDNMLRRNPEIEPLSTASNTHGFRINENIPNTCNNEDISDEENHAHVEPRNIIKNRPIRSRKSKRLTWLEDLKAQKERHHEENYNQRERFLAMLEKHLES